MNNPKKLNMNICLFMLMKMNKIFKFSGTTNEEKLTIIIRKDWFKKCGITKFGIELIE